MTNRMSSSGTGDGFKASPAPFQVAFQNGLGQNYYVGAPTAGGYYSSAMSPDMAASGMYMSWPPPSVSPFDPSRPPPPIINKPPLPNSPPPERPPLPPPNANRHGSNYGPNSLPHFSPSLPHFSTASVPPFPTGNPYRGRGTPPGRNYGARRMFGKFKGFNRAQLANGQNPQPSTSGLQIKTPDSLNEQKINPLLLGGKKFNAEASKADSLPVVNKKKKRRPMSERLPTSVWKREDAQRVLDLEKEYSRKRGDKSIVIKFPDPKLDYEIVKGFASAIQSVHFQNPAGPRSCIAHLRLGSEVGKVIEELNKTPFGTGFLHAEERRKDENEDEELRINDIDPYTLYIGNLPWNTRTDDIKRMFQKAKKVDVGYAQKMKATRYGFVRYVSVDNAIEDYKKYVNELYESRSIIVRFRRNNSSVTEGNQRKVKRDLETESVSEKTSVSAEHENDTEHENEAEYTYSGSWGDEESESVEDNKNLVFDNSNNKTDRWFWEDDNSCDDHEKEAPNLTGFIKNEPEEEGEVISEEHIEFLGAERDDDLPDPKRARTDYQPGIAESEDRKVPISEISFTDPIENTSETVHRPKDWEQIRQEELSSRDEKPDISTLNPPLLSPPLDPSVISSTPITTYGLVPILLPKEEKQEDRVGMGEEGESMNDDFDDDQVFENAWKSTEVKAN